MAFPDYVKGKTEVRSEGLDIPSNQGIAPPDSNKESLKNGCTYQVAVLL